MPGRAAPNKYSRLKAETQLRLFIHGIRRPCAKEMKGTFPRHEAAADAPGAQPMGTDWSEKLAHPSRDKSRPPTQEEIATRAAAAVVAGGAAGGAAGPVQDALIPETVLAPKQRFSLDDTLYFIDPRSKEPPKPHTKGEWLVPHIVDNPMPAVPRGAAAQQKAHPESKQMLPDSLTDKGISAASLATVDPLPDLQYAQQHVHFVLPSDPPAVLVGELYLKQVIEKAERLDYEFALRMQGLQNSTINAVWVCSNAGAEPADRSDMMEQFLRHYMTRFLAQAPMAQEDPETVIREAVQMHQQFCAGWVREHARGLAPTIEAAGEALIGMFFNTTLQGSALQKLTWKQAARLVRRDPRTSAQFGLCLHFYMVKLEQDRGGRNASYKSMFNASSSNMLSINAMDAFLRKEAGYLHQQAAQAAHGNENGFHWAILDWYGVVSQLSLPVMRYSGTKRSRIPMRPTQKAPWEV